MVLYGFSYNKYLPKKQSSITTIYIITLLQSVYRFAGSIYMTMTILGYVFLPFSILMKLFQNVLQVFTCKIVNQRKKMLSY